MAVLLKMAAGPLLVAVAAAALFGALWLSLASFGALLLTVRWQRNQEAKRLYGYRRKPRRRPPR